MKTRKIVSRKKKENEITVILEITQGGHKEIEKVIKKAIHKMNRLLANVI